MMTGESEHKTFISHMHHYSLKPVNFTENERQQKAAAAAETGAETAAAPWQQRQHQSKKLLNTRIMFKMFIMCASDASSFPAPWQAPLLDDRPKRQANTHT